MHWATDGEVGVPDPRDARLGHRWIAPPGEAASGWHAHRLSLGVVEGVAELGSDATLWLEANAREQNGVSFTKGCYVGQEIVSRTHHRGTARTRSVLVQFPAGVSAPEGVEIHAGTKTVGTLGSSAPEGHAIALLRLDRVQEAMAAGEPLSAGGLPLRILRPEWMPQAILDGASHA